MLCLVNGIDETMLHSEEKTSFQGEIAAEADM